MLCCVVCPDAALAAGQQAATASRQALPSSEPHVCPRGVTESHRRTTAAASVQNARTRGVARMPMHAPRGVSPLSGAGRCFHAWGVTCTRGCVWACWPEAYGAATPNCTSSGINTPSSLAYSSVRAVFNGAHTGTGRHALAAARLAVAALHGTPGHFFYFFSPAVQDDRPGVSKVLPLA